MAGGPHMVLLCEYTGARTQLGRLERGLNEMVGNATLYSPEAITIQRDAWNEARLKTRKLWDELEVRLRPADPVA